MVEQITIPPEQKFSWPVKSLLVLGGVVIVAGAAVAGYFFAQQKHNANISDNNSPVTPPSTVSTSVEEPLLFPSSSSGSETAAEPAMTVFATTSLPQDIAAQIVWSKPKLVEKLGWLKADYETHSSQEDFIKTYETGGFTFQGEKGLIILLEVSEGLGGPTYFYVIDFKKQLVVLAKYPWQNKEQQYYYADPAATLGSYLQEFTDAAQKSLSIDYNFTIPALEFPKTLKGPNDRQVLVWKGTYPVQEQFGFGNIVIKDKTIAFTDSKFGKVYTSASRGGFYVHGPDDSRAVYVLEPDFFNKNSSLAQIVWNDGSWNSSEYIYGDQGGCGFVNYISVVTSTDITLKNDLVVVGKTSQGDNIYELKDKNNRLLKQFYENAYFPTETGGKISYEEFIALKPIIFWVDPFNRLIKMQNRRFITPAECGKPVIYLYPETAANVSVQVEPKGGMTYSDPFYNGGWQVKAQPDGKLTELKSGKQYPYLFWEGTGDVYQQPDKGFVIKKEDISIELPKKLAQLGLNQQETKDFMEFWLPRMQAKPYYFVTFLGTQQMNQLAPLTISPRPDTVVRILMDFTPLDEPKEVAQLNLGRTPQRKGFTVIEWGGVIRK